MYENTDERVKKGQEPEFDMNSARFMKSLVVSKHYVIYGQRSDKEAARQFAQSLRDNGVNAFFSYDSVSKQYLIFTGEYNSSFEAQIEAQKAKKAGFEDVRTYFYK